YDQDSNRYEVGKKVLTRNAANQHEILEEEMYIAKDGYMETFVVNETSEDVWFDNMMVMSTTPVIVQETHYGPWGLELTGLGYEYGGIKANKYLYNGKELIEDEGMEYYDYGARMYDATIGRFNRIDRFSEKYTSLTQYQYGANNPIKYVDFQGDSLLSFMNNFKISGGITYYTIALNANIAGLKTGLEISPYEQYLLGYDDGLEIMGSNRNGQDVMRPSLAFSVMGFGAGLENIVIDGETTSREKSYNYIEGVSYNGEEKAQSIGFSFKAGLYFGINLNIEYKLSERETMSPPDLNYNIPGILDQVSDNEVKQINLTFENISDTDKKSIVEYLKQFR
ncbi:hypothetical protein JYB64_19350, partial [Algoriphagus aestuarii]|nr:hypothetical protein [Algoriphagus aestuarii]